jgi:hypothetical protein
MVYRWPCFKKAAHNLPRVSRIRPFVVGRSVPEWKAKQVNFCFNPFLLLLPYCTSKHKYIVSYISTIWYSGIESRGLQRANHLFTGPHFSLLWLGLPLSLCPSTIMHGERALFWSMLTHYVVHVAGVKCFIPRCSFGIMRTLSVCMGNNTSSE